MRRRVSLLALVLTVSPGLVAAQDSLTVESRLDSIEVRLNRVLAALGLDSTSALPTAPLLPAGFEDSPHVQFGFASEAVGSRTALDKSFFVILHHDGRKVADWVAYHLTRENLEGTAQRRDNFRADPALPAGSRSELADYRRSGYDRGHMAPAGAFKRSETAMSATFVLSNMAPQRPQLNRQIWRILEEQVRSVVEDVGEGWVVTGPLYLDADSNRVAPPDSIGPGRVAVPTHFFKVMLTEDRDSGVRDMFAFIMPNSLQRISGRPADFLVSVDHVEELAQLDFFAALPDPTEQRLEGRVSTWPHR